MRRWGGILLQVLAALAVVVIIWHIFQPQENTIKECTNHIDDNGNGHVDLDDDECKKLLKPVIVAARNLNPKNLQRDDLKVDLRLISPDDAFKDDTALIGKRLCDVVSKDEYIRTSYLVWRLGCMTPERKRAMAVKVDDVSGVAGFIKAGDRVDVLVTVENPVPRSVIVLQNIPVLKVGSERKAERNKRESSEGTVVTLEVGPGESQRLAFASSQGKLHLAMRNSRDTERGRILFDGVENLMHQKEVVECMGSKCVVKWVNN